MHTSVKEDQREHMVVVRWVWFVAAYLRAWCAWLQWRSSWRYGQSTVEYALVGALVVIAAAGALTLLGGEVTSVFSKITTTLSGAASATH